MASPPHKPILISVMLRHTVRPHLFPTFSVYVLVNKQTFHLPLYCAAPSPSPHRDSVHHTTTTILGSIWPQSWPAKSQPRRVRSWVGSSELHTSMVPFLALILYHIFLMRCRTPVCWLIGVVSMPIVRLIGFFSALFSHEQANSSSLFLFLLGMLNYLRQNQLSHFPRSLNSQEPIIS